MIKKNIIKKNITKTSSSKKHLFKPEYIPAKKSKFKNKVPRKTLIQKIIFIFKIKS